MGKQEFLARLRKGLSGLPQEEIEERLTFYSEMIDDRIEEGLSEEDAVASVGSVDEIVAQAVADTPLTKIVKANTKAGRRLSALEIVLLILGAPIWFPLGIAAFSVVFSLYVSLWSVIISLWAVFISLATCSLSGVVACIVLVITGNTAAGIAFLAAGFLCGGLSILLFLGSRAATRGTLHLTKAAAVWTKNCFRRKETAS